MRNRDANVLEWARAVGIWTLVLAGATLDALFYLPGRTVCYWHNAHVRIQGDRQCPRCGRIVIPGP